MLVNYGDKKTVYFLNKEYESILDIAIHSGMKVEDIWNFDDPVNKELKEKRKNPFWIMKGEYVAVPNKETGEKKEESGQRFVYQTVSQNIPVIDVYLGFMDEEVNARLAKLIEIEKGKKKAEHRPVILIERGQIDPDKPILEWRLGNYKVEPTRIIQVSPKGQMVRHTKRNVFSKHLLHKGKDSKKTIKISPKDKKEMDEQPKDKESEDPEKILGRAMAAMMEYDLPSDLDWLARGLKVKRYFDVLKLLQHRRITKEEDDKTESRTKSKLPDKATGEGPWLSIVRFGVGDNKNAPIIVIRTPEMGLQPSLMSPYIAFLLKAISAMSSQLAHEKQHKWEWPLRVSMFGAQGSTNPDLPPGTTSTVVASLLVGVEVTSDITVTAKDQYGGGELEATFEHSKDSTDAAPHRKAKEEEGDEEDARLKKWRKDAGIADDKKGEGTFTIHGNKKGKVADEKYHKYTDIESKTKHRGYAVICLCTPAGSYDFLRITVEEFRTKDEYKDWMYLLRYECAKEGSKRCEKRANDCEVIAEGYKDDEKKKKWWNDRSKWWRDKQEYWNEASTRHFKQLPKEFQDSCKNNEPVESQKTESVGSGSEQIEDVMHLGWADDVLGKAQLSPMKTIERAEDLAAWMYQKHWDLLKIIKDGRKLDKKSPFYEKEENIGENDSSLKEVVSDVRKVYKDSFFYKGKSREGVITLTVSYFGGDEDKEAAEKLGIKGVAMEDYHVLKVLRSAVSTGASEQSDYPIILGWRIDRINCDPKELPPNIVSDFKAYAEDPNQSALSLETYVKVIIWGLRGVLKDDIKNSKDLRDVVQWKLPGKFGGREWEKYFWSFAPNEDNKRWIPDPFCIEIATDFIDELSKMNPGIAGDLEKEEDKENLKKLAKAVLVAWKKDKNKKTWKDIYESKSPTGTAETARKLMKALEKNWKLKDGIDDGSLLKTWLRPGKWKNITKATLQGAKDEFGGAAIDRAFYKSSNMMALQTMADYFLWEGGEKPIPKS